MYLVHPEPPTETEPEVMRRRALIAAAIGIPAAALPTWAHAAATTPDPDHTHNTHTWHTSRDNLRNDLNNLATHYATDPAMGTHGDTRDSALWIYAQANNLRTTAPPHGKPAIQRLACEAAYFAAGCYLDYGDMTPATNLYSEAHRLAENHPDLRAFVTAQANWVPMYQGDWHTVLRRTENTLNQAERHGGPGLLMGWTHRAHALAHFGRRDEARTALTNAQRAIKRVPTARTPHNNLHYSASKVHFSSANVYAALGDAHRHAHARAQAHEDPNLGWMDKQLMDVSQASLDPDPEQAAHNVRFTLLHIPDGDLSHCVKVQAEDALARLKAKQVLSGGRQAGHEVKALSTYLHNVEIATAA